MIPMELNEQQEEQLHIMVAQKIFLSPQELAAVKPEQLSQELYTYYNQALMLQGY